MAGPLQQFEIKPLIDITIGNVDISFTNASLWMVLATAGVILFMIIGMRQRTIIPSRMQSLAEISYEFVGGLIKDNIGDQGRPFFPMIFSLFMMILFMNIFGLIPYSFTPTSHIVVTFFMAFFIFILVTIVGFVKHGTHFFRLFVPSGLPAGVIPLIFVIEVISYLSRPISLSVRLFANIMAGHTMIKVFASFVVPLGAVSLGVAGALPIIINVALTGFEVLVAFLQAYVFCVLTCLYLNDSLNLH